MKRIVLIAVLLFSSFNLLAQHQRTIVETSPLARALLTNDTQLQWITALGIGTNINVTNVGNLTATNLTLPVGARAGAFWISYDSSGDGAWTNNGATLTNLLGPNITGLISNVINGSLITNSAFMGNAAYMTNLYAFPGTFSYTTAHQNYITYSGNLSDFTNLVVGEYIRNPATLEEFGITGLTNANMTIAIDPGNINTIQSAAPMIASRPWMVLNDDIPRVVGSFTDGAGFYGAGFSIGNRFQIMFADGDNSVKMFNAPPVGSAPAYFSIGAGIGIGNGTGNQFQIFDGSLYASCSIEPNSELGIRGLTNALGLSSIPVETSLGLYNGFTSGSPGYFFGTNFFAPTPTISGTVGLNYLAGTLAFNNEEVGGTIVISNGQFYTIQTWSPNQVTVAPPLQFNYSSVHFQYLPASTHYFNSGQASGMAVAQNGTLVFDNLNTLSTGIYFGQGTNSLFVGWQASDGGRLGIGGITGTSAGAFNINDLAVVNSLQVLSNSWVSYTSLTNNFGTNISVYSEMYFAAGMNATAATNGSILVTNQATFNSGVASKSTTASVVVTTSGITNTLPVNAKLFLTAATVATFTNFNASGSPTLTNTFVGTNVLVDILQPGGYCRSSASGLSSGTVVPF